MSRQSYEIRMQGPVAEISIIGDIDWWNNNSADFTRQFNELRTAGVTELRGYINSGGGHMFEANEIYNLIVSFAGRKTCRLGALAASAATTIACAFTDGIEMAANGQYMIHNPTVGASGGPKEMQSAAQLYENLRQVAIDIYVQRTGLPAAEIGAMMDATTWMNAATAKAKGFITAISGSVAELPSDTAAVLNKYHYAGVPTAVNQALAGQVAAQPANRAHWTLTDWQRQDGEGLAAQMRARTPLFMQLYKNHYGHDFSEQSGANPRQGTHARPTASAPPQAAATASNRAAWTWDDWQQNDGLGLRAMMQANTPEWQQLYKRTTGNDYTPPTNHNKPG